MLRDLELLTFLPQPVYGEWTREEVRFEDVNLRIVIDVEDTAENSKFFVSLKPVLKERFQQLDIWIVSYEIRVL